MTFLFDANRRDRPRRLLLWILDDEWEQLLSTVAHVARAGWISVSERLFDLQNGLEHNATYDGLELCTLHQFDRCREDIQGNESLPEPDIYLLDLNLAANSDDPGAAAGGLEIRRALEKRWPGRALGALLSAAPGRETGVRYLLKPHTPREEQQLQEDLSTVLGEGVRLARARALAEIEGNDQSTLTNWRWTVASVEALAVDVQARLFAAGTMEASPSDFKVLFPDLQELLRLECSFTHWGPAGLFPRETVALRRLAGAAAESVPLPAAGLRDVRRSLNSMSNVLRGHDLSAWLESSLHDALLARPLHRLLLGREVAPEIVRDALAALRNELPAGTLTVLRTLLEALASCADGEELARRLHEPLEAEAASLAGQLLRSCRIADPQGWIELIDALSAAREPAPSPVSFELVNASEIPLGCLYVDVCALETDLRQIGESSARCQRQGGSDLTPCAPLKLQIRKEGEDLRLDLWDHCGSPPQDLAPVLTTGGPGRFGQALRGLRRWCRQMCVTHQVQPDVWKTWWVDSDASSPPVESLLTRIATVGDGGLTPSGPPSDPPSPGCRFTFWFGGFVPKP